MVNLRSLQIMQDNSTVLWGELEDSNSEKVNLNPTDRELLLRIPKPLSLEGPRIHQPKITDLKSQNYSYNLQESYVTHGVQLLSYINDLNKIKEAAINRREKGILPILGKENPSYHVSQQVLDRNLTKKSLNFTKNEKTRKSLFTF